MRTIIHQEGCKNPTEAQVDKVPSILDFWIYVPALKSDFMFFRQRFLENIERKTWLYYRK